MNSLQKNLESLGKFINSTQTDSSVIGKAVSDLITISVDASKQIKSLEKRIKKLEDRPAQIIYHSNSLPE